MAQTPEEAAKAIAEATGYVPTPLTAEQQQLQDLYSRPLPISTSQQTPEQAVTAIYKQDQINQSLTQQDDGVANPAVNPGVGAGTTNNSATSVGSADNPGTSTSVTAQQLITATFGTSTNSQIVTQPNVLDRYASYTYAISWYLLTPTQYNNLVKSQRVNTAGWQLLMQSGGAPTATRNQFFPVDYYMDDLEIDSVVPLHGTNMSNSATDIKFKVVEPNGITLIEQLYQAVKNIYKTTTPDPAANGPTPSASSATATTGTATQTLQNPNYLTAQHCLIIQFYGYDAQGTLVAPAQGQVVTNTQSNTNPQAVIQKYYPCVISNITFRVANRAIEYHISAKPIPHYYNASSDRGTIPFAFSLSGSTVAQLLQGNPVSAADIAQFDPGARQTTDTPKTPPPGPAPVVPPTLGSIVTGQDNPLATPDGYDFSQLSN